MDWLGPCRRLQVGRVLNDDKCVTVPFSIMHTTHLPFCLVGFCTSRSVAYSFFQSWFLCLRPTSCVFPLVARESESLVSVSFTSHPLYSPLPVSLSRPRTLAHAHFYFSHEPHDQKNYHQPNSLSLIPASASIPHNILSRNITLTFYVYIF
jgi:hypothetical protein